MSSIKVLCSDGNNIQNLNKLISDAFDIPGTVYNDGYINPKKLEITFIDADGETIKSIRLMRGVDYQR